MTNGFDSKIQAVENPVRMTEVAPEPVFQTGCHTFTDSVVPLETYNGPCPYIPSGIWITKTRYYADMDPSDYEAMLDQGIRRSGHFFYQNCCPGCTACRLIKIDARRFQPSRSQRRALQKNRDLVVRREKVQFDREAFSLYQRYCVGRHQHLPDEEDYIRFLIESPVKTECMRYYLAERLIGIGWIDVLPNSLSSVYFAFDLDYHSRSLGVFSMIKEIELCRELNKSWLHAGFWVKESSKMAYKSQYRPHQILAAGVWRDS